MATSPEESKAIRRTIRDLVALSALPEIWANYQPQQIVESLADLLQNTLRLHFVYSHLRGPDAQVVEVVRTGRRPPTTAHIQAISQALAPYLDNSASSEPATMANPLGSGIVKVLFFPMGWQGGDRGVLAAGSVNNNFPTEEDQLLLGVGINQAAMVIHRQRLNAELQQAKETAEAANRAQIDFHTLANSISQLAWMADAAGYIFWYNQRWYDYTGTTLEEMQGWGWQKVHHPDEVGRVVERIQRAFATGEPWEDAFPLRSKDGEYRWFLSRALPIRNADGRVVRWFGTNTDVTEQRQMERRYRSLVEATAAIVWNTPASGEWETEQPGWSAYTAQDFSQLRGWGWLDAVHPDDRPNTARVWSAAVADRCLYQVEHRLRRHDGEYRNMLVRAVPILDEAGSIREWVGVHTDIDNHMRVEVALREAKEAAEAANRAKSAFLATMSHEIRTPMNAVLGFSQLMLRDQDLTPRQCQYLGTINRSGEHLLALINDILEMSKIEAGRTTLNPSTFDLPVLLKDLEMMFRVRTDEKKLSFSLEMIRDPPVPQYIVADINKLRQVFINVLGNAVKFTEQGGIVLRVRAEREDATGPFLRIEIEDTGPGISPDDQVKLFRHFEQTKTGQHAGTGTGLGLAISREFVRLMGGTITVNSQVGKGSVFVIHLPLKEGGAQAVQAKDKPRQVLRLQPGQATCRVLIADDIEDNRQLLAQLLAPVGFVIRLATNGAEAVQEFEKWGPHLILMDFRMPVMDGHEAIRRIRAMAGGKELKIIAVSASAMDENRQELMEIGADDFINKPCREADLFQKIHTHLGVEYVYAADPAAAAQEEAAELTPESLAGWPQDLIHPMREAVITADLDQLLAKIQEVEARDPRIGEALRRLAEGFQYQKLLDLFGPEGVH